MNNSSLVLKAELQALLDQLGTAWTAGDGIRYAAAFTEDADYVAFDGSHLKGQAAIARPHQQLFDGVLRGSELAGGNLLGGRLLGTDVAVLHTTGAVRLRCQKKAPTGRRSIQTLVAVRRATGQQFAAFQNTRISLPGPLARLLLKLLS